MIGLEKPSSFCGRRPRQAYSFGLTGDPYACPASRQPVAAPEPEVELPGDDELACAYLAAQARARTEQGRTGSPAAAGQGDVGAALGTRLLKRYLARHLYRLLQSQEPLMA